jgi:hypothetical protein
MTHIYRRRLQRSLVMDGLCTGGCLDDAKQEV